MSKIVKVACPVCDHIFEADMEQSELECPECESQLSFFPPEEQDQQFLLEGFSIQHDETIHADIPVIDSSILMMEVQNLDDEALYDEIIDYLRQHPFMKGVELIELEMSAMGEFRPSVRKQAEGIYILINTNKKALCPMS